jgi:CelD/BcsL family acetyltransferase involved in cellulose biosynthesis
MHTELHQTEVEGLAEEWRALHRSDVLATPFVSPAWVFACWRHYGGETRPWILTVRDEGGLVGLAPLAMRTRGSVRTLCVVGEELGDYWDVLAAPEQRAEVLDSVGRALRRRSGEWDELVLGRLPGGSATRVGLDAAGTVTERGAMPCPGIELPASFDEYLERLPNRRRWHMRRDLRRLDEGELQLRAVSRPAEISAAMRRWHELRLRQWAEQGRELYSLQADDRFQAFMAEVMGELVPGGQGIIWEFSTPDGLVGSYVAFLGARSFFPYLGGYEPSAGPLGIGKIAIGAGIRSAIAGGRDYYDFMIGAEPYKYQYGATDRRIDQLVVRSTSPRSRLVWATRRTVRRVRRLPHHRRRPAT